MTYTLDEDATKQDLIEEKSCLEITPSEKKRQVIRERGGIQTRKQKIAVWMGMVQFVSLGVLCVPLYVYTTLTFCPVHTAMIVLYVLIFLAIIAHIVLIFTAIRKVQPGGLWIPMGVQLSIVAVASVQLFLMISLFARIDSENQFEGEMCANDEMSKEDQAKFKDDDFRKKLCMVGAGTCALAFAIGTSGYVTNMLLYVEVGKDKKAEDDRQNQLVLERQTNRLRVLHDMIKVQEKRTVEADNEAIKTAVEPMSQPGVTQSAKDAPKSEVAKSKHRMI